VTNRFLARFGVSAPLSSEELRKWAVGKNFRTTALDLAVQCGEISSVLIERFLPGNADA